MARLQLEAFRKYGPPRLARKTHLIVAECPNWEDNPLPQGIHPLQRPFPAEKERYDAALRRKQLSLVLAGKLKPSEATELKALFED